MADIDKTLESLYTHFILRDLAGKIVPGSIFYMALFSLFMKPDEMFKMHSNLPIMVSIILIAILWVLGLAVQAIGIQLHLIKYSNKYPPPNEFNKAQRQFIKNPDNKNIEIQRYERFEAIREAYGNSSVSILLSFFIWLIGYLLDPNCDLTHLFILLLVSTILYVALLIGHKETINNFDSYWEHSISNSDNQES